MVLLSLHFGKKASAMLAGHSIVRLYTHRAGRGTAPKYRECPTEVGTIGSY